MAAPVGPKKVHRYTLEFKIQAVRLANHPEIQTQDVCTCVGYPPVHALEVEEGLPGGEAQAGGRGRRLELAQGAAGAEGRCGEALAQAPGEAVRGEGARASRGAGAGEEA